MAKKAKKRKPTTLALAQHWCDDMHRKTGLNFSVVGVLAANGERMEVAVLSPTGVELFQIGLTWRNDRWDAGSCFFQFGVTECNAIAARREVARG